MSKNTKIAILILLLALIAVGVGVAFLIFGNEGSGSSGSPLSKRETTASSTSKIGQLAGTWRYKDGTKYSFKNDMTGGMTVENYTYKYTFTLEGSSLKIDYERPEVHDAEYTYEIVDGKLKLIGGEGTARGEYEMERVV